MSEQIKTLPKGSSVWIVYPFCKKEYEKHTLKKDCFLKGRFVSESIEEANLNHVVCEAYLTKKEAASARLIVRGKELETLKNEFVDLSVRVAAKDNLMQKIYRDTL